MIRWLAAAAAALALHAHAQFPNRPITVVIPLAAGDAADTASRAMAEEISRTLRQPVVAVNRPGAGGVVQDYRSPAELAAEIREEAGLVQAVAKQSGMIK